jgi:putative aminopeptidase FrvX
MNDYSPQEISLANEIAEALDDRGSLALFLQFAKRYKEEHLRGILDKVLSVPERKIKKTRGALFTFLVSQHAENHSRY